MLGLNFVPSSKRYVTVTAARAVMEALEVEGLQVEWVGVVADMSVTDLVALRRASGVHCLQLHGHEPPEVLTRLFELDPAAHYQALRIGDQSDIASAAVFPGERLLVDAKADGALGGSGHRFDWTLAKPLAQTRALLLAGGLTPMNVAQAALQVRPWAVDVASGVESAPGVKDPAKMATFVQEVHRISVG
ncbi:MAG: hypothetical protein RJA70_2656 [Pseudomonadota bacterium]